MLDRNGTPFKENDDIELPASTRGGARVAKVLYIAEGDIVFVQDAADDFLCARGTHCRVVANVLAAKQQAIKDQFAAEKQEKMALARQERRERGGANVTNGASSGADWGVAPLKWQKLHFLHQSKAPEHKHELDYKVGEYCGEKTDRRGPWNTHTR